MLEKTWQRKVSATLKISTKHAYLNCILSSGNIYPVMTDQRLRVGNGNVSVTKKFHTLVKYK